MIEVEEGYYIAKDYAKKFSLCWWFPVADKYNPVWGYRLLRREQGIILGSVMYVH